MRGLRRLIRSRRGQARGLNKTALQKHFGLAADPEALLFGVVSRLTWQKGIDLILANLDLIEHLGGQLAVLGSGEPALEEAFRAACEGAAGPRLPR